MSQSPDPVPPTPTGDTPSVPEGKPAPIAAEHGSPNIIGPQLPIPTLGVQPTKQRPIWFVAFAFLAQFGLFTALLVEIGRASCRERV